jgi:hypothetical protein
MRHLILVACVLGFLSAPALAGDGQVSSRSLARMGLSGMKVVSDHDGLQVRGQFAIATSVAFGGTTILSINSPVSVGNTSAFSAKFVATSTSFAGGAGAASSH